jgi:hypothetical protein
MSKSQPDSVHKFFIVAAFIGISGWMLVLFLIAFWHLMPVTLPDVKQPLPILNANHQIAVGEKVVVQLDVVKKVETTVESSTRYISCDSGNLVTLTSNPTNLPVGTYTIISDSVTLPNKVTVGDVCTMNFRIVYRINPMRVETLVLSSEPFTVVKTSKPPA